MDAAEPHVVSVDGFHEFTHFDQNSFAFSSRAEAIDDNSGHNSHVPSETGSPPIRNHHSATPAGPTLNPGFDWAFAFPDGISNSSSCDQSLSTPLLPPQGLVEPADISALGFLDPTELNGVSPSSSSAPVMSRDMTQANFFEAFKNAPQPPIMGQSAKRKRKSSLPLGCVTGEEQQQASTSRLVQRSISIGSMAEFQQAHSTNQLSLVELDGIHQHQQQQQQLSQPQPHHHHTMKRQRTSSSTNSPCLADGSPVDGLTRTFVQQQHQPLGPQTQGPAMPATAIPPATRAADRSFLATIPEGPSATPMDLTWSSQTIQDGNAHPSYMFDCNADMTATYTMPAPPAAPQLPSPAVHSNHMMPSPAVTTSPMLHSPAGMVLTPSLPMPPTVPRASHQHARAASMSGVPTFFDIKQQEHALHPPLPQMEAYSQQIPSAVTSAMASAMVGVTQPPVGIGRPTHTPAHLRRLSDTAVSLATYQPNMGGFLRSTSVPQPRSQGLHHGGAAFRHNGTQMYGGMSGMTGYEQPNLGPPPVTYSATGIPAQFTYMQHQPMMGGGYVQSTMPVSPPRKRPVARRQRVGQPLKPGPKGKKAPKMPSPVPPALAPAPDGATLDPIMYGAHNGEGMAAAYNGQIKASERLMEPVSVDEFRSAFTITQQGNLVIKSTNDMDQLVERLLEMHFSGNTTIVDQCFRECYQETCEWNEAAQKRTKYFKCRFEECRDHPFPRKSAIDSHVKTHVGFREFRCTQDPECTISFVRKHDRDRHHLTHRESKTFKCAQCGEDFARSDALLRHGAKVGACKARMVLGM
ncbi:unnamed protein product [Cutaneotrichosporon oleaginosum]